MGYTHYIYRKTDFTVKQWEKICLETLDIIVKHCDRKKIVLAREYDAPVEAQPSLWGGSKMLPTPPEVTPDHIRFNGWKDEGHETFIITRERPDNPPYDSGAKEFFDFCKTARKPYDLAVCLVMLSMKRHAPKSVRIASDGDWDMEWVEARKVYKELFGVDPKCPFAKTAMA
jgi:hypothetical protein